MHKTFSLQLLFFKLSKACCFLLFAFSFQLLACHSNPNIQTRGESYLQGEWQQDSISGQKQLVSYALFHFKFSCDSFFVAINNVSRVNTGADSCMQAGHWREYVRGTYQQSNDTLHLKGQFANADYTVKDDKGCFRSGDYEEIFKVIQINNSNIKLLSTSNTIPVNAHLIKKLSCHPKPI